MHDDNEAKNMILVNDETSRRNPDLNPGIYITAAKLALFILVADNRIEK